MKGFRASVGPSGKRVRAGIPGTGIYYDKRVGTRKRTTSLLKQQLKEQRELEKIELLQQAQEEVNAYDDFVYSLSNVHTEPVENVGWEKIAKTDPPFPEGSIGHNEQNAIVALDNYKPSIFDKLFKRIETRKNVLQNNIEKAKYDDLLLFQEWKETVDHADRVLNNSEMAAYIEALEKISPFQSLLRLGSGISAHGTPSGEIHIEFAVNSESILPSEVKTLTKTGKLSTRKMGVTKYNEMMLSYVTGATIAIAKETFAVLPIESMYVHCLDTVENKATGHLKNSTLLSVLFDKKQIETLAFENINPTETIKLFQHNMKFLKTKGFVPIEPINMDWLEYSE